MVGDQTNGRILHPGSQNSCYLCLCGLVAAKYMRGSHVNFGVPLATCWGPYATCYEKVANILAEGARTERDKERERERERARERESTFQESFHITSQHTRPEQHAHEICRTHQTEREDKSKTGD